MSKYSLSQITLLATLILISPTMAIADTPPATTYQPGFWQPVARVDLSRPVTVVLVNETNMSLEYDFTHTSDVPPQPLKAGEKVTLQEALRIPAYLLINRSSFKTSSDTPLENLKFNVSVDPDNVVMIKITGVSKDTPGNSTFNLHETGAIYVY